jgi:hypothetical protein
MDSSVQQLMEIRKTDAPITYLFIRCLSAVYPLPHCMPKRPQKPNAIRRALSPEKRISEQFSRSLIRYSLTR